MEMENPRRSFDRSGVVKKPRLTEDSNRPFTQRSAATPRFTRTNDTVVRDPDADDLGRAGAYQPQTPHHELVSQYKSALAELTFNSKPIITNLTIIAGENVQAAKAIAATVCANILEVPSEQKLPSLYLLDSIVKNIGREYVKHFAPRLPEVFCKAYKHVDASIHQSMRHLFGTWKGVFPLQTLQMIEKELGFTPMVNGSSSGAASSRPDSQSNRHSIHVNPKYLEKQRLQQSSRAKGTVNDMTGAVPSSTADIERPDRPPSVSTGRQLVDPQAKMHSIQRSQRDAISKPVHEKNIGAAYGDYEYGSDLSRNSSMGIGRGTGRVNDQAHEKTWFGTDVSLTETMSEQRNGFTVKHGFPNYSAPKSANTDLHLQPRQRIAGRSSSGMSSSWKNSEEEEFMWDMPSRLSDQNAANICINPRRENWTPDDPDKMGFENHLRKPQSVHDVGSRFNRDTSSDSLSTEQKDHAVHGQRMPSPWQLQEPNSVDGYSATLGGLPTSGGSQGRLGVRPPIGTHVGPSSLSIMSSSVLGSTGSLGQQRLHSGRAGSPSGQSAIPQRSPSPSVPIHQTHQSLGEQDFSRAQSLSRSDIKTSPFRGNLNTGPHGHSTKESSTLPTKIQPSNLQKVQIPDLKGTVPPGHQSTFSQHLQLGNKQLEHSIQSQKPLLPPVSNFLAPTTLVNESDPVKPHDVQTSGQPSTSSLLAAVFKSGILSNNLVNNSLANSTSQDVKQISAESDIQPPLPSGHAPTSRKSSDPRVGSESASGPASRGKPLATANSSKRKVEQTQLPSVRPSSSLGPSSAQASSHESKASTPISTLLSSLVAKGLISASKSESPSLLPPQIPTPLSNQSSSVSATKPLLVSSAPSLPPVLPSTGDEISISNPAVECLVKLPHSIPEEIDNLIGFEFKPDIIREQHPDVVSALFDDLPHRCSQCGLRLKLKERLDRHLEWHNVKQHGPVAVDEMSRRWYANSNDWVAGKVGVPLGFESTVSTSELRRTMDNDDEPMVPADDNQYACVLCGELFEDYYSQERDEWMFTRAVYMTLPSIETSSQGPIVHVECISESSARDVGLVSNVKLEKDA